VPDTGPAVRVLPCEELRQHDPDTGRPRPCWVNLDLRTGNLRAHWSDDDGTPPAVAALWTLRWPVAAMPSDAGDLLLHSIVPAAHTLVGQAAPLPPHLGGGLLLTGRAGAALDEIHRRCAATFPRPT
jgi:hypothetical protein